MQPQQPSTVSSKSSDQKRPITKPTSFSFSLSWCPDCVRAELIIYKTLEASADDVALQQAYVGDRPT
ncbi:hypothetical protein Ddye_031902 [Dipteronia dyeriana]|uniref:Thioredoxin domain-containing protein n=1 Tax=Dipteronia dyeriana TaxID=168575 RepID=A0AAD9WP51_9ROSI|nr:hypothetical protein Ddye_031902 [Dipteronia dyeriana]